MSESLYHLVLRGTLRATTERAQAVAALAQLFKVEGAIIERLLNGKPSIIKRDLDAARAKKWLAAITQVGADAGVISAAPAAPESADQAPATDATATASGAAFSLRPQAGDILDASEKAPSAAVTVTIPTWGLAPVGADLLDASERAPVAPPRMAPALDLAAPGTRLSEVASVAPVAPPDTAHLVLQKF